MQYLVENYPSGMPRIRVPMLNNKLHGWMKIYNEQGELLQKSHYVEGKLHGRLACYHNNQIQIVSYFQHGLLHGIQKVYHQARYCIMRQYYQYGKINQTPKYFDHQGKLIDIRSNNHE